MGIATETLRQVPSMDALLRSGPGKKGTERFGRPLLKRALQETLDQVRAEAVGGGPVPEDDAILARALEVASRTFHGMTEVLNATGVLLHTGLGRAPLPRQAATAAAE